MPGGLQPVGFANVAADVDRDVVIAHAGRSLNVNDRLRLGRVGKGYFATFEVILRSIERNLAPFVGADAADGHGAVSGAADSEIGIAAELGDRSLHL